MIHLITKLNCKCVSRYLSRLIKASLGNVCSAEKIFWKKKLLATWENSKRISIFYTLLSCSYTILNADISSYVYYYAL